MHETLLNYNIKNSYSFILSKDEESQIKRFVEEK